MVDVASPPAEVVPALGSLVTAAPLGAGNHGMTLGGGYSVLLPFFLGEIGYGLSRRVDVTFRFETVAGLFHYPQLSMRWAFLELGKWTFGGRAGVAYSLFAIDSGQTNLTSTLYLPVDVLASRPVTRSTDILAGVGTEFDLFEHRITDGEKRFEGTYRFDAAIFRVGAKTQATTDLGVYVIGRLRVPVETVTYRAEAFFILPSIEVGGTFVW